MISCRVFKAMAKPRINVHISQASWRTLDELARRPGVSKASIVDAALQAFFAPEMAERRDEVILRRLDRLNGRLDRLERDLNVNAETLALFIRYYMTMTPPLPEQEREAAQALGKERFEYFIEQVTRRLVSGAPSNRSNSAGFED